MPRKKKTPNRADGRFEIKKKIGIDIYGNPIRKSFYSSISKSDAEKQYQKFMIEREAANQSGIGFIDKEITFREWAQKWLDIYKKHDVSPQTFVYTYQTSVDKHLIPYFGNYKISDIRPANIKEFYTKNTYFSASTLSKMRMCLNGIFNTAVDNGLCTRNPCQNIKFSSTKEKNEKKIYTEKQIKCVFDIARFKMPEIAVILGTGLRRGEILALKWSDISFKDKTISVNRAVADVPGKGVILGPPKWDSYRTNPVSNEILSIFKHLKHNGEFIFPKQDGTPQSPKKWSYKEACFMKNLPEELPRLSPHELRHTYGTHLRRLGVDIYTIQKLMGHKDISVTSEIYVHNEIDTLREAIKNVAF